MPSRFVRFKANEFTVLPKLMQVIGDKGPGSVKEGMNDNNASHDLILTWEVLQLFARVAIG